VGDDTLQRRALYPKSERCAVTREATAAMTTTESAGQPKLRDTPACEVALTPRQLEVVALLARDLTQRQVAKRLGISADTVKGHVNKAIASVGCQSARGLTALYWGGEVHYALTPASPASPASPTLAARLTVADMGVADTDKTAVRRPAWATLMAPPTPDEIVASRVEVDPATGCWLWRGYVDNCSPRARIGSMKPNRRGRRYVSVRRWLYERIYGPLPTALHLYGTCRSPHCVNPHPGHARVARARGEIVITPSQHVLDGLAPVTPVRAEAIRAERLTE